MYRKLFPLQIRSRLYGAVSRNIYGFASDMRAAYKGNINTVGHRNQHGSDMIRSPHTLTGSHSLYHGTSLHIGGIDSVLLIISQHLRQILCGYTGSPVKEIMNLFSEYRLFFHRFPILRGNRRRLIRILCRCRCFLCCRRRCFGNGCSGCGARLRRLCTSSQHCRHTKSQSQYRFSS